MYFVLNYFLEIFIYLVFEEEGDKFYYLYIDKVFDFWKIV